MGVSGLEKEAAAKLAVNASITFTRTHEASISNRNVDVNVMARPDPNETINAKKNQKQRPFQNQKKSI